MPWKLAFIFAIFSSFCCLSQESKTDARASTATLSGTVVQADTGQPLKNVQVVALRGAKPGESAESDDAEEESAADRQFSAKTNEQGNFELPGLAPGTYYLKASRAGMIMKGGRLANRMLLNLEPGQSQKLNLAMLPAAVITGHVFNEEGEPMQHVGVGVMRYVYSIRGRRLTPTGNSVETDDKGEYRLFGLEPGSYLVAVDPGREALTEGAGMAMGASSGAGAAKANAAVYVATYYPNEISPEQATPIVLKPGDETQANFSLTRVPAHNISGSIAGLSAPKPADKDEEKHYRFVIAMREGLPSPAATALVKDSSFKMSGLPAGKYKIIAMEEGNESGSYGYKDVTLGSTDVAGVVVSVNSAAAGHINGIVHAEGEAKLDYSKLFVALAPQSGAEGQSDAADVGSDYAYVYRSGGGYAEVKKDGSFKMDVAPSPTSYQVVITARSGGFEDWFTSKVLVGGKDVLDSGFKASEARGAMEIIISKQGAALEGNVLDAQQKPFSNAEIIAMPTDPKLRKRYDLLQHTVADQQGHFKIRGVRPGEYIIMALEDSQDQPFMTELFLKNNSGKIASVKLEAGAKQQVQLQAIPAAEQ